MTELSKRLRFNLTDAFLSKSTFFANLFKRHRLCTVKTIAHTDYACLVRAECINNIVNFFVHRFFNCSFFRTIKCVVFKEIANLVE